MATLAAVGLMSAAVPVEAKAAPASTGSMADAQAPALLSTLPASTSAELAAGLSFLSAHPLASTVEPILGPVRRGVTPEVTVGVSCWGVRVNLTNGDIHAIVELVLIAGFAGAGTLLCGEAGPIAVGCAIVGSVLGYMVAEIVWNQPWNNPRLRRLCRGPLDLPERLDLGPGVLKTLGLEAAVMVTVLAITFYVLGVRGPTLIILTVVPTVITISLIWSRARRTRR